MATEILISVTSSPTLSKSGLCDFSITLSATSNTSQLISADLFLTILRPQMDVFGYQGFTFTDVVTKECIARPHMDVCFMSPGRSDPKKIPPYRAQQPYRVTHEMQYWTADDARWEAELADEVDSDFAECASSAPNRSANGARATDQSGRHSLDPTAAFEIGHSYEIGLGNHWNLIRRWNSSKPTYWVDWWYAPALIDDRTAGPLRLVFVNKAIFEVTE